MQEEKFSEWEGGGRPGVPRKIPASSSSKSRTAKRLPKPGVERGKKRHSGLVLVGSALFLKKGSHRARKII